MPPGQRPGQAAARVSDDGKPVLEVSVLEEENVSPSNSAGMVRPTRRSASTAPCGSDPRSDPIPAPQQLFHQPDASVADGRGRTDPRRDGPVKSKAADAAVLAASNRAPPPYSQAVGLENVGGLQLLDRTRDDMCGERFGLPGSSTGCRDRQKTIRLSAESSHPKVVRTLGH